MSRSPATGEVAAGVARAMVTELAHSTLAEATQILVVGDLGVTGLGQLGNVTLVDDWPEAVADIAAWTKGSRAALDEHGWPTPFAARGHDGFEDALAPLLVVADHPPVDADLSDLLGGESAVGVVAVSDLAIPGTLGIDCAPDELALREPPLSCRPQTLSRDDLATVIDILADAGGWTDEELAHLLQDPAEDDPDILPDDMPSPTDLAVIADTQHAGPPGTNVISLAEPQVADRGAGPATDGAVGNLPAQVDERPEGLPEPEILIRLLGEVAVEGARKPLTGKQTAVVAYIAAHGTVTGDRLEDAIWLEPSDGPPRRRLVNTVSECRAALGATHLPPATNGRYRVGDGVVTDLDLFDRHVHAARGHVGADAVAALGRAMELVRGRPFQYLHADKPFFSWIDMENWATTWEVKVARVTDELVRRLLDLGDTDAAIKVADKALQAFPTHAVPIEALMRAYAAAGDLAAVHYTYRSHASTLEKLGLDPVAETTAALYTGLRRSAADGG